MLHQFEKIQVCDDIDSISMFSDLGIKCGFVGKSTHKKQDFFSVKQIHSKDIFFLSQRGSHLHSGCSIEADGIATLSSQKIAVKTADCLPLLASTEDGKMVFAIHAGWKGIVRGIIDVFMRVIVQYDYKPSHVRVILGPCISGDVYEVGADVADMFVNNSRGQYSKYRDLYITSQQGGKYNLDIASFASIQLLSKGFLPENIMRVRSCTYQEDKLWYSHRRDKEGRKGSNWSWIKVSD